MQSFDLCYCLLLLALLLLQCEVSQAFRRPASIPLSTRNNYCSKSIANSHNHQQYRLKYEANRKFSFLKAQPRDDEPTSSVEEEKKPSVFDQVASKGLAGVLAIAVAESIFWALGMPLAALWVKFTTGEWIDLTSQEGQLQAAGFTFGYGGFATIILQYRVTLFAIPLVPIMEKLVVIPGKKIFGEAFGEKKEV